MLFESMDPYGRIIDYLRISVTDRCNERCLYCMPEGYKGWAQKADHLTASEIVRIAEAAVQMGFRKFRLTGGEPTIRPDLVEIAAGIARLPGVKSLGISTNGTRLAGGLAHELKKAGVTALNLSLDALDPALYHEITGGQVAGVLQGMEEAQAAGFERIKLNTVLMRGINEGEIWPLVLLAAERNMPLRFIELMPLSRTDVLNEDNFLSIEEVKRRFASRDTLEPVSDTLGYGPARYFRLQRAGAVVGFIGAMTTEDFCASCNKIRLTADGKVRPCLGRHNEVDLLATVREGGDIQSVLHAAIAAKPQDHEFAECYQPGRPMTAIGG